MSGICKSIRDLKPGLNRFAPGFYVRVQGKSTYWILKVQVNGRRREFGLGGVSELNISQAKSVAARMRAQIEEGIEPVSPKKSAVVNAQLHEDAGADIMTFRRFSRDAIQHIEYLRQWTSVKHAEQWRTSVERYACSVFGDKPIAEVGVEDVVSALKPIWEEKPETAQRLQERLAVIFSLALTRRLIDHNPAIWKGCLEHFLPSASSVKKKGHHAAVPAATLKALCEKFVERDCLASRAVVFGILTAFRAQEFCLLRWDEVDLQRMIVTIPPERRKDKKPEPFVVPLSRQARECLLGIPRDSEFVFGREPGKHLSTNFPRMHLQRHCAQEITMHGCRSTFSDWCAQNGKNFLVSEKCLMHAVGGKVFMAYQKDDLLPLRRQLLEEWAECLLPTDRMNK